MHHMNSDSLSLAQDHEQQHVWEQLIDRTFPTDFVSSLLWVYISVTTNLPTKFLFQVQKQQEDSAMILASRQTTKQTQKRKTGEKTREETEQTHEKNRQQGKQTSGLQKAPIYKTIQNHLEDSKCWNSKKKFLSIEQPSSSI